MTAAGLWGRLMLGSVVAVALLVAVSPPLPSPRLPPAADVPLGVAAGIVLYLAVSRELPVLPSGAAPLPLALATALFLALAAANEEILWRRVVLGELLRVGAVAAIAVSALGFALAHRARPGLHLLTGSAFGAVYLSTGALLATVAAHWIYNLLLLWLADRRRRPVAVPHGS
jgi:membrane protease YdiL (CAAX protease family)